MGALTLQRPGGVKVTHGYINSHVTAGRRKKIRIRGTENALPTPHNPTYTQSEIVLQKSLYSPYKTGFWYLSSPL